MKRIQGGKKGDSWKESSERFWKETETLSDSVFCEFAFAATAFFPNSRFVLNFLLRKINLLQDLGLGKFKSWKGQQSHFSGHLVGRWKVMEMWPLF